jgi:F-type H+-transporting ATPase subunit a
MSEHEFWLTKLFNDYLAGVGNAVLTAVGRPAVPRPWETYITMQIFVVVLMMILFALLRSRLSMDKPGGMKHLMEEIYLFLKGQAEEIVGHHGHRYLYLFATLFFFILISNLIGVITAFESPTMFPQVTLGCALLTFLYYNMQGIREQGAVTYLKHFMGPVWWLAPLMIPIEIVGHLARPMSLTVRLYANMFAGEQVTLAFLGLTYAVIPVVFMGLHVFVSLLQAYIFTLLTMVYVGAAVEHEH